MIMKKLIIGSVLAISSVLTVTGCTSVNATTDTTKATTTKMQKHHKAGMKNGMHKGGMHGGGMRGAMAQLDLTATQQAQIKAITQEKYNNRKNDRSKYQAERAQMQQQMQTLTNA